MTTDAAALSGASGEMRSGKGGEKGREYRAIGVVSAAHFVNHFHNLVLPPLFPFLKSTLGIGFVELGFALTVANILAVAAQLPVGFLVDHLGSRRMLVLGLVVSASAFIFFGLAPSYPHLLIAMAFIGLANSVFHPADYALLSAQIAPARVGRAFSIHTFSGFLGNAIAPVTILPIAMGFGLKTALFCAGGLALVATVPLLLIRGIDNRAPAAHVAQAATPKIGLTAVLTPTIIGLTGFFALLSLSGSGISNFSVVALRSAFDTPLSTASIALTVYLSMQALGVLAGGFIADMTKRHAEVAAVGYAVNACIVLAIGTLSLGALPLFAAMGGAGLLGGLIMPSRDMLVRAAAPSPSAMGRTFGVVTSGFNIGGMVGPLMFGFIMDHGAPRWVFGASVIVMITVAVVALVGDRRSARRRALAPAE